MLDQPTTPEKFSASSPKEPLLNAEKAVIRFAGDSGDGIQTLGGEFANSTASHGHGFMTFPDFPAEIRAPQGTLFGVSAFQIQIGDEAIVTHGDQIDILVAFNPASLKTNLKTLVKGGVIIADSDSFTARDLKKAGYENNPLEDDSLDGFRVISIPITELTRAAALPEGVTKKDADKARNIWALGLVYWLFGQDTKQTEDWLSRKFAKKPDIVSANIAALKAGYTYGDVTELDFTKTADTLSQARLEPGKYRSITGIDGLVMGLAAVSALSGLRLHYCSYPITPATAILHGLSKMNGDGVTTYQAEDEIAAACAAIGSSFAGSLGVTGTSGPGLALKGEALGLAVGSELPLIVIDVQRAGPSTGMPTKVEQADLNMALYGRHGEAPMPVLAPSSPGNSFDIVLEAARIALTYMTPVTILSDAYTGNSSEPWKIPDISSLSEITPVFEENPEGFHPFKRHDDTLARAWAKPGTPGLAHRLGGLERSSETSHISYDPDNHQVMTDLRQEKLNRIQQSLAPVTTENGINEGDTLVIGWGSTWGAISTAARKMNADGHKTGHLHLRHLSPMAPGIEDLCKEFNRVMVAELNNGQLYNLLRMDLDVPLEAYNKVAGQPFTSTEIINAIQG